MNPILIVVAGGTASGKTTVVKEIISEFKKEDVTVISHDDYYKDLTKLTMEERTKVNYDHPDSLDNDLFVSQLKELLEGRSILKPIYDFTVHNRSDKKALVEPTQIIITEGILTLEDERVRNLASIKIYVESDDDIRFIRRLKRDTEERNRTVDSVIEQYLTTVKPMHYSFVKPTKRYADIIIPNNINHTVAVKCIIGMINDLLK